MVVTIHQPEHLPWLGFFDKIRRADTFVMLDHVQYRKNYFQNRNRIRTSNGSMWLTVPVLQRGTLDKNINQIQINNQGSPRWREKCWTSLVQHYGKAEFWPLYRVFFEEVYTRNWGRLVQINEALIAYLLSVFGIEVEVVKSSEIIDVAGRRGELLLDICRKTGADTYLSGVSGMDYLDVNKFADAGVKVIFQEFHHPVYRQLHEPFLPCMSAIDLLFNYGPASLEVLKGVGVPTLDYVFE